MIVVKYTDEHFDRYNMLNDAHGIPLVHRTEMPKVGYVLMDHEVPVAYAFLRLVEGGFGQIDGLIANPEYRGEVRNKALDMVIQECLLAAKELGITQLFAFCKNNAPIERAKKHGFVMVPHSVLAIDLAKEV